MKTNRTDRNHEYLYTVELRGKDGKFTTTAQIRAFNLEQAAHKLGRKLVDARYVTKEIIR